MFDFLFNLFKPNLKAEEPLFLYERLQKISGEEIFFDPTLDGPETPDPSLLTLPLFAHLPRSISGLNPLVQSALNYAEGELGVRESGSNTGKRIREYQATTTLGGTGWSWCAAYVNWAIIQASKKQSQKSIWIPTASCDFILYWAREHDILSTTPRAGDVFLVMANENDSTHTGFVKEVRSDKFITLEGNTNNDGSREGIGVFSLTRPRTARYRYVRWDNLLAPVQTWKVYLNDKFLSDAQVEEGIARMPVYIWAEAMGFKLGWNQDTQTVTLNGKIVPKSVSIINGRSYLPVRTLAEFSGLKVKADGVAKRITITR